MAAFVWLHFHTSERFKDLLPMRVGVKVETERLLLILEAAAGKNKLTRRLVKKKNAEPAYYITRG